VRTFLQGWLGGRNESGQAEQWHVCRLLGQVTHGRAQARLLTYRNEYTFDGVEYAPLKYKIIMRLVTINTVATTQVLRDNLNNIGVFAATVNGNINKINSKFDKNYTQLLARDANVNDPVGLLFEAYHVVGCYNFKTYISATTTTTLTESSSVSPTKPS
jgi:hypothetical protein